MTFDINETATEAEKRAYRLGQANVWVKAYADRMQWNPEGMADAKARLAVYVETGVMNTERKP